MFKESKIDELSTSLNGLRIAQLLACCQAELSAKSNATAPPTGDLINLKEVIQTTKREEIDAFLSMIIHGQVQNLAPGK